MVDQKNNLSGGIYFHIPFCKQACHYCDFHFITSLKSKDRMVRALERDLVLQHSHEFIDTETTIGSIYFGGGTPSLLEPDDIETLIATVQDVYGDFLSAEVTLEANPDDMTKEKVSGWKQAGINRLSVGVQSFFDEDLQWMNRAHRSLEAEHAIKRAQDVGITNLTADLIYGFPLLTDVKWARNIETMLELQIPHISAYSMTVEPRTALGINVRKGNEKPMSDEQSVRQFQFLMDKLEDVGFSHYEISNWARQGYEAVHNGNYWKGRPYLGIGPSAHGYNGKQRRWNIANNALYMQAIEEGRIPFDQESLSLSDRYNEYVMTSLRTSEGIDTEFVQINFGTESVESLEKHLQVFINQGKIRQVTEQRFALTRSGKLMADGIASDLFLIE